MLKNLTMIRIVLTELVESKGSYLIHIGDGRFMKYPSKRKGKAALADLSRNLHTIHLAINETFSGIVHLGQGLLFAWNVKQAMRWGQLVLDFNERLTYVLHRYRAGSTAWYLQTARRLADLVESMASLIEESQRLQFSGLAGRLEFFQGAIQKTRHDLAQLGAILPRPIQLNLFKVAV